MCIRDRHRTKLSINYMYERTSKVIESAYITQKFSLSSEHFEKVTRKIIVLSNAIADKTRFLHSASKLNFFKFYQLYLIVYSGLFFLKFVNYFLLVRIIKTSPYLYIPNLIMTSQSGFSQLLHGHDNALTFVRKICFNHFFL